MTEDTAGSPDVLDLPASWAIEKLERDTPYLATVNGVVPYGIFVDVTDEVSGLVHESNLDEDYSVGDEVVVTLDTVLDNGDIAFDIVDLDTDDVVTVTEEYERVLSTDLTVDQETIAIEGRVAQIKQTGGPTIFHVTDGAGVVACAAFAAAGVRAHPAIERDDLVRVVGSPEAHADGIQLEVESITAVEGDRADELAAEIEEALDRHAEPASIDPLVEWEALDALWPGLKELATILKRTVLEHRPIRIRHHADGDGMCAAVPVAAALEAFTREVHADPSAAQHLVTRSPSRAPYYEMEDATRDLNQALEDREEHGQQLPLLLMLDNGSTDEDVPGYRNLAHYDIPIAVVDHHHPDEAAVADLLKSHINPYLVGEDYRVTTGMLCVELARMIAPDLTEDIEHVPAVAGIADRSEAEAMRDYLGLAQEAGYDREMVSEIGDALDFASHWLRYNAGESVIRDILGLQVEDAFRHHAVVDLLSRRAREAMDAQLEASLPHVDSELLENGAQLHRIDLDRYAHRFQYPAPGRTTGAIHDEKAAATEEPTITIGYGPDFCVLRSDGVRLDIPNMVAELQADVAGGGVTGGGHLVVGSIKFVSGRRDEVIDALVDKMAEAEIDEELASTAALVDGDS